MTRLIKSFLVLAALTFTAGAASATTAYTTADLNLRYGPGTDYPIVSLMPVGSPVEILECDDYGWCQVNWEGWEGYAVVDYLDTAGYAPAYVPPAPVYNYPVVRHHYDYRPPVIHKRVVVQPRVIQKRVVVRKPVVQKKVVVNKPKIVKKHVVRPAGKKKVVKKQVTKRKVVHAKPARKKVVVKKSVKKSAKKKGNAATQTRRKAAAPGGKPISAGKGKGRKNNRG